MILFHELRDRRRIFEVLDEEDRGARHEHPRGRAVQLPSASHELRVRWLCWIRVLRLLQVIDVLDLDVRAEAVVVAAEVRLPVCQKDRLVLSAAERRRGEVPPLREEKGQRECCARNRSVPEAPPARPAKGDAEAAARTRAQRVGLGRGEVGAAVAGTAVIGGAVTIGSVPDLN